jgi:hypothetical protein
MKILAPFTVKPWADVTDGELIWCTVNGPAFGVALTWGEDRCVLAFRSKAFPERPMLLAQPSSGAVASYDKDWAIQITGVSFGSGDLQPGMLELDTGQRCFILAGWKGDQNRDLFIEIQSGEIVQSPASVPNMEHCAVATSWRIWKTEADAEKPNALSVYEFPPK